MVTDGQIWFRLSRWSTCGLCVLEVGVEDGAGVSDAIFIWGSGVKDILHLRGLVFLFQPSRFGTLSGNAWGHPLASVSPL